MRCAEDESVDLATLAERYVLQMKARGRASSTLSILSRSLRWFVGFLRERGRRAPHQIRTQDILDFKVWVMEQRPVRRTPTRHPGLKSAILAVSAVRGLCRWLMQGGVLLRDPAAIVDLPQEMRSLPRVLTSTEVTQLLESVRGSTPMDLRDCAMLEVLYSAGLRAGELLGLDLADLDLIGGEVLVRRGKGRRSRRVPLGPRAGAAVHAYLEHGRLHLALARRCQDAHALFLSRSGARLVLHNLETMVRRRSARAGLSGRVTPHTLRHTAAVHFLKGGASARHVQEFLGHASLETTAGYTHLTIDDLKTALRQSHPRGRLRT